MMSDHSYKKVILVTGLCLLGALVSANKDIPAPEDDAAYDQLKWTCEYWTDERRKRGSGDYENLMYDQACQDFNDYATEQGYATVPMTRSRYNSVGTNQKRRSKAKAVVVRYRNCDLYYQAENQYLDCRQREKERLRQGCEQFRHQASFGGNSRIKDSAANAAESWCSAHRNYDVLE